MTDTIRIGDYEIGEGKPCFIIAEAGVNHNKDLEIAKKLIDAAVYANADAVKFQTFKSEGVMTKHARMASYQIKNIGKEESQLEMARKLEMPYENFLELKNYCDEKGIMFLSTPHSPDALEFLDPLVPAHKIGSGDLTNLPFLKKVAQKGKPVILSTGMATLEEVREAAAVIKDSGNDQLVLLHCTSNYPCPLADVNLRAMASIKKECDVLIGYSDHTVGIDVMKLASKYGAVVLEKHFTIDKNLPGPDHKASLDPEELKEAVKAIRNSDYDVSIGEEVVLGSSEKKPTQKEKEIAELVRKSVVAKVNISKGAMIKEEMLAIKRPGTGMLPKNISYIIGKTAAADIPEDALIKEEDIT